MKINVAAVIHDLSGQPMREPIVGPGGTTVPGEALLTVREVLISTCLQPAPEDAQVPGHSEKAYRIALACSGTDDVVDISTDQAEFLKARLPKRWGPLIVGRAIEALDGDVGTLS